MWWEGVTIEDEDDMGDDPTAITFVARPPPWPPNAVAGAANVVASAAKRRGRGMVTAGGTGRLEDRRAFGAAAAAVVAA